MLRDKAAYMDYARTENIVLIGIADASTEYDDRYELHRLLSTLLSTELSAEEKLGIMENEYSILVDDRIRVDVSVMCNLSQGILERGEAIGAARLIFNMYEKGYTLEQIADIAEKSIEEVRAIIANRKPVLA